MHIFRNEYQDVFYFQGFESILKIAQNIFIIWLRQELTPCNKPKTA